MASSKRCGWQPHPQRRGKASSADPKQKVCPPQGEMTVSNHQGAADTPLITGNGFGEHTGFMTDGWQHINVDPPQYSELVCRLILYISPHSVVCVHRGQSVISEGSMMQLFFPQWLRVCAPPPFSVSDCCLVWFRWSLKPSHPSVSWCRLNNPPPLRGGPTHVSAPRCWCLRSSGEQQRPRGGGAQSRLSLVSLQGSTAAVGTCSVGSTVTPISTTVPTTTRPKPPPGFVRRTRWWSLTRSREYEES